MRRKLKQDFGGARWWAILGLIAIWSIGCQRVQAANPPIPYIQDISPVAVEPGGTAFTLTITGVNFTASSVVQWTAAGVTTPLTTSFNAAIPTQLTAKVLASDIAEDGTGLVTVVNSPDLAVSNVVYLPITHSTTFLTFRATQQSASGANHPFSPVVADFNGDGNLDLAVANDSAIGAVSIFLGDGDGSFQPATSYNVGSQPEGLAVGDFNGDGIPDLAVANSQDATITILLGKGDGTFPTSVTASLTPNTRPSLVAVGDFNGDGNLDLAVTCLGPVAGPNGFVTILLGDGTAHFGTPANYGTILQPVGLALADFDGNGTLDLAVSDATNNEVWILSGNGDGTFSSGTAYGVDPAAGGPAGLVAGDFDNKNGIDLAVVYPNSSELSVLLNSGNSANQFPTFVDYPTGGPATFLVAGDLNGDGILDLAAPDSASSTFSTLLGNGDGTFASYVPFTVGASYSSVLGVASADFNGDGRLDFAFTVVQAGSAEVAVTIQAPVMTPSPSSLDFGNQTRGTTSSPQTITLTNSGGAPLFFYTISSTDPADFPETTTCGKVLESGDACAVSVTFTPSKEGSLSGRITITNNVTGFSNPQLISLTGTGVAPEAGLSPASLAFSTTQLVGTPSAPQNVTLSNTGNGVLTINSITITTGFTQTNTCGGFVNAGSNCTITVSFAPTAAGALNGTLTVTDNSNEASSGTQTVSLTGSGVAPTAGLAPGSLTFASQIVGTASAGQALTLSNTGSAALSITNIAIGGSNSGDFSQSNTCGTSVAAGASCAITVSFKPTATGTRSATVTATDNSGGSNAVQTASLTGSGVVPVAGVTPSTLTFAGQSLETTSAVQTVTLSNSGAAALTVTSIVASGDFAATNNCGSSVAAGANCAISVSFKPSATGTRSGTLTVTDNSNAASNSTQTVSLSGTGVGVPQVSLAPSSLTFAGQTVGTTSAAQVVTLSNTGTGPLTLSNITTSGDFANTSTCGTSLSAGASCTLSVTFTPSTTGTRTGVVTITDNAAGSPQTILISGTGTAPAVKLSATSLSFSSENVGSTSPGQSVTITNTGTASLTLTSITASGDFSQSSACGSSLGLGASCTVTVTFKPTTIGSRTGTLTLTDNASPGTQTVSLTGTGQGPEPSLTPASLDFSGHLIGATSAAQTVTLKNAGNAPMNITNIAATGDFTETSTCSTSLAVNASCTISVTFKATASGALSGALTVSGDSQTVALSGTGQDFALKGAPTASVSPGQSATYNLSVAPVDGLNQAIALSCAGAPSESTCTVSPGSVTLNGSSATSFAVTVATTAASGLALRPRSTPPFEGGPGEWLLLVLLTLGGMIWLARRRPQAMAVRLRLGLVTVCMLVLLALGMAACGGGGSSGAAPSSPGTPAGTYSLTVTGTATSGSATVTHNVTLTLQVNEPGGGV
ncbi:MAG TPA: choice-of-anchor D domain-containing protein [Terriglobia bacterium]